MSVLGRPNGPALGIHGQEAIRSGMAGNPLGGVPLAFSNGLALSGLVHVIHVVLVVLGLRARWTRTRTPRERTGTVLEGAAA